MMVVLSLSTLRPKRWKGLDPIRLTLSGSVVTVSGLSTAGRRGRILGSE